MTSVTSHVQDSAKELKQTLQTSDRTVREFNLFRMYVSEIELNNSLRTIELKQFLRKQFSNLNQSDRPRTAQQLTKWLHTTMNIAPMSVQIGLQELNIGRHGVLASIFRADSEEQDRDYRVPGLRVPELRFNPEIDRSTSASTR